MSERWRVIGERDAAALEVAEQSYGDSWKQRGGVGAFMMLARKWDRIENQARKHGYNIFETAAGLDPTGIIDDIRDLRRYLILVEAEVTRLHDEACGPDGAYVCQD